MLFRFDETLIGAFAMTIDGADFTPGDSYADLELKFWWNGAVSLVRPGAHFTVCYGGDVGAGEVTAIL
jgi:hypothetical protein